MSAFLHSLTHGWWGLGIGYVLMQVSLWVGFVRFRGAFRHYFFSPLVAVPLTLLACMLMGLLESLTFGADNVFVSLLRILVGSLLFPSLGYRAGKKLSQGEAAPPPQHRRGAVVSNAPMPAARRGRPLGITLAGVPLAPEDETKHFKFIGTTGTGKSTAIREILSAALARGDRVIIADPDGGYLARFYDAERGDVILNPFDGEALKWDLFAEITNDYDVEQLARSLIPDNGASDRTWSEYARTFFTAVTQQAIAAGARNDAELYRLITSASVEELRMLLAGTAAGPFLEPGNEKMFGSVRSIASSAVRALKYTTRQQASPFSVRRWVKQGASRSAGGKGGVLFFPYKAGEIAALRSVISAWMRIAIFEAMDREEADQHLWFVIDELDALGEIDGLKDALARLRKFGGRCILGFQSIGQVSGTYGRGVAETIVENCGNTLILRCSASEHGGTSEFASKLIGQREVLHTTLSETTTPRDFTPSTTTSQNLRIEPAVMASQIERLPDLQGFLKLASVPDWHVVTLTPTSGPPPARPRKPVVVTSPPAASGTRPVSTPAAAAAAAPAAAVAPAAKPARARKGKVRTVPAPETARAVPPPSAALPAYTPDIVLLPDARVPTQNAPGAAESPG